MNTLPASAKLASSNTNENSSAFTINRNLDDTSIEVAIENSRLNDFANEIEYLKENAVASQSKEVYVRFMTDKNDVVSVDPKAYSELEYEMIEDNKLRAFPISQENNWIRLKIEVYKMSNNKYELIVFYDWKTKPIFTFKDVLGIGHDSSFNFDNQSGYMYFIHNFSSKMQLKILPYKHE